MHGFLSLLILLGGLLLERLSGLTYLGGGVALGVLGQTQKGGDCTFLAGLLQLLQKGGSDLANGFNPAVD